jgi:hypothetical protein
MKFLTGSEFAAPEAIQLRAVVCPTPEMGEDTAVCLAELDADQRDELETLWAEKKAQYEDETNIGFRAWVVAYCLCDQQRQRMYSTSSALSAAADALGKKPARMMSRLFNTACRLNGLLRQDVEAAEKNSVPAVNAAGNGESHSPAGS